MKNQFTHRFMQRIITALLNWQANREDRSFFIILCEKDYAQVAFKNAVHASVAAGVNIGYDPGLAAAFETVEVAVEVSREDTFRDEAFIKACNEQDLDAKGWRWKWFDNARNLHGEFYLLPQKKKTK